MKRFLSFFFIFALSILFAVAGDKVTYRYAPELGKTITYHTIVTIDVPTHTGKVQQVITKMATRTKAVKHESGVYTLEVRIGELFMEMPGMPMIPQVATQLKELNAQFDKVLVLTKTDELGRNVGKPEVTGLPAEIMGRISTQMEQMDMTNNMKAFPATPIAEGDTWGNVLKDDKKDIQVDYRLVKITPTALVVHSQGKFKLTAAGGQEQDFNFKGEAQFNRTTGELLPGTMKLNFEGSAKANGDSFPMKMQLSM